MARAALLSRVGGCQGSAGPLQEEPCGSVDAAHTLGVCETGFRKLLFLLPAFLILGQKHDINQVDLKIDILLPGGEMLWWSWAQASAGGHRLRGLVFVVCHVEMFLETSPLCWAGACTAAGTGSEEGSSQQPDGAGWFC